MKTHKFQEIANSSFINKKKDMVKKFHCKDCNTIIAYPIGVTENDVNKWVNNSNLPCLEPVIPVE